MGYIPWVLRKNFIAKFMESKVKTTVCLSQLVSLTSSEIPGSTRLVIYVDD